MPLRDRDVSFTGLAPGPATAGTAGWVSGADAACIAEEGSANEGGFGFTDFLQSGKVITGLNDEAGTNICTISVGFGFKKQVDLGSFVVNLRISVQIRLQTLSIFLDS